MNKRKRVRMRRQGDIPPTLFHLVVSYMFTTSTVWDSAVLLSRFLMKNASSLSEFSRVVELGSGTGLAGLVASKVLKSASVTLTDLPGCVDRLDSNIALNQSNANCVSFIWGQVDNVDPIMLSDDPCLVLAADCLLPYNPILLRLLADSISFLVRRNPKSQALIAYEERCPCDEFYIALRENGMTWHEIESVDRGTLKITKIMNNIP